MKNEKSVLYIFNQAILYDEKIKSLESQSKQNRKETQDEKKESIVTTNTITHR